MPVCCQVITWTNAALLLIVCSGVNLNEIYIKIWNLSFKKMHLKISFSTYQPFFWPQCVNSYRCFMIPSRLQSLITTSIFSLGEPSFKSVQTTAEWWRWSQSTLLDSLYWESWYNGDTAQTTEVLWIDYENGKKIKWRTLCIHGYGGFLLSIFRSLLDHD